MTRYRLLACVAPMVGLSLLAATARGQYSAAVLADNPLHYYRFEESDPLFELAADSAVPGGVHGTYTGGITLGQTSAAAGLGNAARFDGASGTFVNPGTPFHPGNSITTEAWAYLDAATVKPFNAIVARWDGSYELNVAASNAAGNFNTRTGANAFAQSESPFSYGQWHHIVGVYDASAGVNTIYIDGLRGTSQTVGGPLQDAGSTLFIGATRDGAGSGFNWAGMLDEVAVYGHALPQSRIQAHYQAAGFTVPLPPPGQPLPFTENFDGLQPGGGGAQYQTGANLTHSANLPGWARSGAGAVHAMDRDPGAGTNWAPMMFNLAGAENVITVSTAIDANDLGITYNVAFDAAPAVYAAPNQRTQEGDVIRVDILDPNSTIVATYTVSPGTWDSQVLAPNFTVPFTPQNFTYVGTGSGDVKIRISPIGSTNEHFGGAVDNLVVTQVPEPSTWAMLAVGLAGVLFGRRRLAGRRN